MSSAPPNPEARDLEARATRAVADQAPAAYRVLAARIAAGLALERPRAAGLSGGQGAGKSSLARLIEQAASAIGLRIATVGLDDFYLTCAERRRLAERIHPLLETRGPPGTHDVARLAEAIEALGRPGPVELPVFDKGRDDRAPDPRTLEGPFDVVILEGWCVGARPAAPDRLAAPLNPLERDEDPEGVWRTFVNDALAGDYARLWSRLGWLGFLAVPDLDAVRRWRGEQEAERPPARRLDAERIDRFVQHYERITLDMLTDLPRRADLVARLSPDHTVAEITTPKRDARAR